MFMFAIRRFVEMHILFFNRSFLFVLFFGNCICIVSILW